MLGNAHHFFSKKKLHSGLTWAAGLGTFSEVLFSALAIDEIEVNPILRWCALIVSGMVALQTSLFKDNVQSLQDQEEKEALLKPVERNCMNSVKQGLAVSTVASSLVLVPLGQFIRGYFQMYSMLLAQEVFKGSSESYHFSSILIGIITTYFSAFTEGAATFDWLRKKNWMPDKIESFLQTLGDSEKSDSFIKTGKTLALIGSINMAVLESFSFYLLSQNFKLDKTLSSIVCFLICINLCLQTLAFQGKKFLENFQCEVSANNERRYFPEPKTACEKIMMALLKVLFIAAPAFAARFSLSWFTIYSGLNDTDHEHLTQLGESAINFFAYSGGLIAAVDNLFSATQAASHEVDLFNIQSQSLRLV
jgi:hypothetical protein